MIRQSGADGVGEAIEAPEAQPAPTGGSHHLTSGGRAVRRHRHRPPCRAGYRPGEGEATYEAGVPNVGGGGRHSDTCDGP